MSSRTRSKADLLQSNWGTSLVERLLIPFSLFAAPGMLLGLIIFFLVQAFSTGVGPGFRSFAAVLLPLMALTLLVVTKATPSMDRIPGWIAFAGMVIVAAAAMQLLTLSTSIPIVQLVLSAAFSLIVFVRRADSERLAPYCLGIVLGALGYVVILGVPGI